MRIIELTQNQYAIVDKADYGYLSKFNWFAHRDKSRRHNQFTARMNCHSKQSQMHRFILKVTDTKIQIDHINGDPLDNRRSNLRLCGNGLNQVNSGVPSNNKSGYKGVYKRENGTYYAGIRYDKKYIHIGSFKTDIEAHKAYCKKGKELYGEFFKVSNSKNLF